MADCAVKHPKEFNNWHKNNQFIIALQVANRLELNKLIKKSEDKNLEIISFLEPDINDLTSVAFVPQDINSNNFNLIKSITSRLKLAGSISGHINKKQLILEGVTA